MKDRQEVIAALSELIRSRAEWAAANLNDPEWANGLAEEILDTLAELDPMVWA